MSTSTENIFPGLHCCDKKIKTLIMLIKKQELTGSSCRLILDFSIFNINEFIRDTNFIFRHRLKLMPGQYLDCP